MDYHAREGGLMALEDLAEFHAEIAPALKTTFHDYEVAACGFWCQGPVFLQMLNLIEPYDWPALGHNTPRALHILVEAMKLAFADREAYYGDPRFVKVPADALLSKAYADLRRGLIREDRAWPEMPPPGDPEGKAAVRNGHATGSKVGAPSHAGTLDTSYVSVIDEEGNAFSATPSDPGGVDSPVIPGVGCVVSPRGSQGWLVPGHPSEVAGGKRPRLTPAPSLVLRDGRAFMAFGTPGGDVQQQAMLQVLLNMVAYGMAPQQAVEAPRLATRSFPDSFWPHTNSPGRARCRGPHRPRDARGAGEAGPRHHRLARLRLARGRGLRLGGGQGRRAPGRSRPTPRRARHRLVAGARLRPLSRHRFAFVSPAGALRAARRPRSGRGAADPAAPAAAPPEGPPEPSSRSSSRPSPPPGWSSSPTSSAPRSSSTCSIIRSSRATSPAR